MHLQSWLTAYAMSRGRVGRRRVHKAIEALLHGKDDELGGYSTDS